MGYRKKEVLDLLRTYYENGKFKKTGIKYRIEKWSTVLASMDGTFLYPKTLIKKFIWDYYTINEAPERYQSIANQQCKIIDEIL